MDGTLPPRHFDFEGAVVVVTGAAAGIGRATAMGFAADGATVVGIDVDTDALQAMATDIQAQGGAAHAFTASVADADGLRDVARQVESVLGRCDVLVNNAGVLLRGPANGINAIEQWQRTFEVNASGAFYASRAFYELLRVCKGCIVNVASIHAYVAVENSAAYTASKGALKQLTQALALEFGPLGIRVNAVAPGLIPTAMTSKMRNDTASSARFLERVPLGRVGDVADVSHAIRYLASPLAGYITGVTLPVDGGYLAN
jgi:meso-butanediol dehydrogenase/(S,S)-butanediol dehydrogenase/diacetyl reductase